MNYKLSLLVFLCVLFACQEDKLEPDKQGKDVDSSLNDKSFRAGWVRIKLNDKSERNMQLSSTNGVAKTGLTEVDQLAMKIGASKIERVFPYAGKFEARTRQAGLHLWYDVYFDNNIPITRAIADFSTLPEIDIVEPVRKIVRFGGEVIPVSVSQVKTLVAAAQPFNDPRLPDQWHYDNPGTLAYSIAGADINLFSAWTTCTGDPEVIVSVVDGGIDYNHEDLEGNMFRNEAEVSGALDNDDDNNGYKDDVYGWNFVDNTPDISPHSHGTHVAGTIAAMNNNGKGVCGVAGGNGSAKGVRVMSCQIFKHDPSNPQNDIGTGRTPTAIKYGADNGAVISQNSWGYDYKPGETPVLEKVMKEAIDYFIANAGLDENGNQVGPMKGGIVIFAAGNENTNMEVYPASYEKVLSVASMAPDYVRAYYSNYGAWVDITAPGGSYAFDGRYNNKCPILSTIPGNQYGYMQGTSMACPHVSGVAALVISKFGVNRPGFTPDGLRSILLSATNDIDEYNYPYKKELGSGYIDAGKALLEDKGIAPDPVTDLQIAWGSSSMLLTWSMTADEDNGVPKTYNVYWSLQSLENIDFDHIPSSVKMQSIDVERKSVGEKIQFTISGLTMSTTYYVGVVGVDVFGNRSQFEQQTGQTLLNQPPVIVPRYSDDLVLKANETRQLLFDVTEPEGETWTHTLTDANRGVSSAIKEGAIVVTINASEIPAGQHEAVLRVEDATSNSAELKIPYKILPNSAPTVTGQIPNVYLDKMGGKYTLDLSDYFQDSDMEMLEYTIVSSVPGLISTSVENNQLTIVSLKSGGGTITITAKDGIGKTCSSSFLLMSRDGSQEIDLYPNPVVKNLNIRMGKDVDGKVKIKLYNSIGSLALESTVNINPFTPGVLDMSQLSGGTYTIVVDDGKKEIKRNIIKL